jgi:hypothetical protein
LALWKVGLEIKAKGKVSEAKEKFRVVLEALNKAGNDVGR